MLHDGIEGRSSRPTGAPPTCSPRPTTSSSCPTAAWPRRSSQTSAAPTAAMAACSRFAWAPTSSAPSGHLRRATDGAAGASNAITPIRHHRPPSTSSHWTHRQSSTELSFRVRDFSTSATAKHEVYDLTIAMLVPSRSRPGDHSREAVTATVTIPPVSVAVPASPDAGYAA